MKPPEVKRLLLPAILLVGLTLFFTSGANEVISWDVLGTHYAVIKTFAGDHIWLGYLAFFCSYVLAVAFSLPIASLLTLAGGAVLGWPAVILVVTAATTGAGLVFLAARNLFTDLLRQRARAFFTKLEKGFSENAFFYLRLLYCQPSLILAGSWPIEYAFFQSRQNHGLYCLAIIRPSHHPNYHDVMADL